VDGFLLLATKEHKEAQKEKRSNHGNCGFVLHRGITCLSRSTGKALAARASHLVSPVGGGNRTRNHLYRERVGKPGVAESQS
jgi:hypothetical protein